MSGRIIVKEPVMQMYFEEANGTTGIKELPLFNTIFASGAVKIPSVEQGKVQDAVFSVPFDASLFRSSVPSSQNLLSFWKVTIEKQGFYSIDKALNQGNLT